MMKNQLLVIHGADSFKSQKDYLAFLRNYKVDIGYDQVKRWKSRLPEKLGKNFQVIAPSMPCKQNAKYGEWKIWLEKHFPFLKDGVILLGHSLGGLFLVKYLSENKFPKKIPATFLVAAPFGEGDFSLPKKLGRMEKQAGKIFIYHSQDDPVVPISDARKYKNLLPEAELAIFKDLGHFKQENFPEIVKKIKSLNARAGAFSGVVYG